MRRITRVLLIAITKFVHSAIRISILYKPLKTFFKIGTITTLPGVFLVGRFLYFYIVDGSSRHIQSLIIAAIFIIAGLAIMLLGLLGDIISANRNLGEELLYRLKKESLKS